MKLKKTRRGLNLIQNQSIKVREEGKPKLSQKKIRDKRGTGWPL